MKQYCFRYRNSGDGKIHEVKHNNIEDAFIDLIDILDNPSNSNVECWIENN